MTAYRYKRGPHGHADRIAARDRAIIEFYLAGGSLIQTARQFRLRPQTIRAVLKARAPFLFPLDKPRKRPSERQGDGK